MASEAAWDRPRVAVEELVIGTLDGSDETTFGFIGDMAPAPDGGIYVFTGAPPALRYFDGDGRFIRQLGREGRGPGEYLESSMGLGLLSDGRIVLRDQDNVRFNVYGPDGSYADTWTIPTNLFIQPAMTVDSADHVFLKAMIGSRRRGGPWPIGLLHVDPTGQLVDTIPPPAIEGEPGGDFRGNFQPERRWAFTRNRQIVIGISDAYRFEIRELDGRVTRVEKAWTPVPLEPGEREAWQAFQDRQQRTLPMRLEPIPSHKPAFQDIYAGLDGTIWIQLHTTAERRDLPERQERPRPMDEWPEPGVFDVFEPDGSYLGEVRAPTRTRIFALSRTHLWGVQLGDFDEHYAVRWRLEPAPDGP